MNLTLSWRRHFLFYDACTNDHRTIGKSKRGNRAVANHVELILYRFRRNSRPNLLFYKQAAKGLAILCGYNKNLTRLNVIRLRIIIR